MNTRKFRNVAIIAHVDHGKTTLVDGLLQQSGIFHNNEAQPERVMDSNPLERERGITILAKNTSVQYKGYKINIVDTPGHADFGSEVERALSMVDGVLLVVDAFEGAMPQTKFVLSKALALGLKPIVVVNKIDRPDARPLPVYSEVFDLFLALGANDQQLEFPVIYTSAKVGTAQLGPDDVGTTLEPLLDMIIEYVPAPKAEVEGPFQMRIANLDYDSYRGKYLIGKVERGQIDANTALVLIHKDGSQKNIKISQLYTYEGLNKNPIDKAIAGDIVALTGVEDAQIGETIANKDCPEALPYISVDEPTLTMTFLVNTSPMAGTEGTYVTSRQLRERLARELITNVGLRVTDGATTDIWQVAGRGELHLSILIENMRREGYELAVGKPQVIFKEINGQRHEPIEQLVLDVPNEYVGPVIELVGVRKGEMTNMFSSSGGHTRLEFIVPSRGIIGFRNEFLTATRGNGVMNYIFDSYQPHKGEINTRRQGSLIAWEDGITTTYGLLSAEDRGTFFINPGTEVYEGMIVGVGNKEQDIEVNVCKKKHLTNMRSSNSEETVKLKEPQNLSLEEALEFINDDELVEVTPKNIRLRKKYLKKQERARANKTHELS